MRAVKAFCKQVGVTQQMIEQRGPTMELPIAFRRTKLSAVDDKTENGLRLFYKLESSVTAREEKQLYPALERALLCPGWAEVHFESDEIVLFARRSAMAGEIVLAGGEKGGRRAMAILVAERGGPVCV